MKTSELIGTALDWAVAKAEGLSENKEITSLITLAFYNPSTNWTQGGPIIEREKISLRSNGLYTWLADDLRNAAVSFAGETPLVAAMRVYVASKLGDEVEIPDELCKAQ